ncbi:ATP-binding protein [Paraburkholderia sp. J10-1]|uniref:ATP-binding protein n=1 Tax=Paraburkholderia sp. J10-1 TaxID=2805430 RepID=UPI002AB6E465|nr:winged helix-turn-helix domain-containing protein [Paraburkholderia sp. J10-1]
MEEFDVHANALSSNDGIAFGPFLLLPARRELLKGGKAVAIGSRALDILIALVERHGETVDKRDLIVRIWPRTVVEECNLKTHVAALRKALQDDGREHRYVVNVPGRGYCFVAAVNDIERAPTSRPPTNELLPASRIPPRLRRLVGRENAIESIFSKLLDGRVVTIVGPGGIGKTTVAVAVAHKRRAEASGQVSFVDLAPLTGAALVPSALATALGSGVRSDNPIPGLVEWLVGKRMLIVLDSCEHLIDAVASMAAVLLEGVPDLQILATSREPIKVTGEVLHRLPPLSTPLVSDALTASSAMGYASIELFVERTCERVSTFQLDDPDAPIAADICRRLDGNPLAIELAAGRVDAFGVQGVSSLLTDRFALLTGGRRDAPARQQTLMVTLDWSYDLLPEGERIVFRRLGIFAGYFDREAAARVAANDSITAADMLGILANLVDKSLVFADIGSGVTRYRLLDTTVAYARKRLLELGEIEALARGHANYYLQLLQQAEEADQKLLDGIQRGARGNVADNVRAALDWAFSEGGDPNLGIELSIASVPLWLKLSLMNECRIRIYRAIEAMSAAKIVDDRIEMQLLSALGVALYSIGPGPEARSVWTRVLQFAERFDDTDYRLRALWGLWVDTVTGDNHGSGLTLAKQFAQLASKVHDPVASFVGDRLVGTSLYFLGEQGAARTHFERMLSRPPTATHKAQILRFQFDQVVAGRGFFSRILWVQGYPDQAFREAEASVEEALAHNHSLSLCYALGQSACAVALLVGDFEAAQRNVQLLLEQSARHELRLWQTMGRCFSGILHIKVGHTREGIKLLSQAINELRSAGFALYHTAALCEFSAALGSIGELHAAQRAVDEAIEQSSRNDERWCLPELLRTKGELMLAQFGTSAASAAEALFQRSFQLALRQGACAWQLRTALSLAKLHREEPVHVSHAVLARIVESFTEGFKTYDLVEARAMIDR